MLAIILQHAFSNPANNYLLPYVLFVGCTPEKENPQPKHKNGFGEVTTMSADIATMLSCGSSDTATVGHQHTVAQPPPTLAVQPGREGIAASIPLFPLWLRVSWRCERHVLMGNKPPATVPERVQGSWPVFGGVFRCRTSTYQRAVL